MKINPNILLEQLNRLADSAKERCDAILQSVHGVGSHNAEDYRFYNKVAEALPPLIDAYKVISDAAELFHEIGMAADARKLIAEEAARVRRAPPGAVQQREGFTAVLEKNGRTDEQIAKIASAGFEKLVGLLVAVGWRDAAIHTCNPLMEPDR